MPIDITALYQGGGGGTSKTATSTGDLVIPQTWIKPRFIKFVWVKSENKPYRIELYRKTNQGWELIDSKVQNESKIVFWSFPNGLYCPLGIMAKGIQVESGDTLTLKFEGVYA